MTRDLDHIFHEARALTGDGRGRYLSQACGSDAALRAQVEALLAADADAGSFLAPAVDLGETIPNSRPPEPAARVTEQPGQFIGRFKLLQQIGEGGFGSVWMAEQREPVVRKVALKIIKLGMDTRQVIARFEAERQALALMDHANIAKVLDAGATETGRPYFVMELCTGDSITEYCDRQNLSIPERLELFAQVCQAVQHAHQKGLIHRDIKPSNILVATQDGRPHAKVIDFGIAKATASRLTEKTLFTEHKQLIGTPQYMSPEQAEGSLDIDTRTDVYSLGVLLYELLTGTTPFDPKSLRSAAYAEIQRIIREVEPPKPSTRLSQNTDTIASVAAKRHIEPRKLGTIIRGELDWIVMKCLEKDRQRRYETANGLAMDIRRYLAGEAVLAAPPSTAYRMRKFVRKNRAALATAAGLALMLVTGAAVSTWQAVRATRAEASAQRRLTQLEKGNEIITSIFTDLDIRRVKEGTEPLEEVLAQRLAKAGEQLEGEAVGDPLMVAGMQNRLGVSLLNLGHPHDAIPLLINARATHTAVLGPDHPETLNSMNNLAGGYGAAGKIDLALPLHEETLRRRQANLGANHPDTLLSMNTLAMDYQAAGKLDLALPLFEEVARLRKATLGADDPATLCSMNNLAYAYQFAGRLELALQLQVETMNLSKARLGADHPDTIAAMANLAECYRHAGTLDLALPLCKEALELSRSKMGSDNPGTLNSMNNLALCYSAVGKPELALPLLEESVRIKMAKLGPDHPDTLLSRSNLAEAYRNDEKLDLALPLSAETLSLAKAKLGGDHPITLAVMNGLAQGYQAAGHLDQALPLFEETLNLRKAKLGPEQRDTLYSMNDLARAYKDAGKLDQALALMDETVRRARAALGADHPDTLKCMGSLAEFYAAAGKLDLALPIYEENLKLSRTRLGANHRDTLKCMGNLGEGYWRASQLDKSMLDKSIPLFEELVQLSRSTLGTTHSGTFVAMANLGVNYKDAGRIKEAIPLLEEAFRAAKKDPTLRWVVNPLLDAYSVAEETAKIANLIRDLLTEARRELPKESPQLAGMLAQIGMGLLQHGDWTGAEPLLRECVTIRERAMPDDWLTFNTRSMLGGALLGQKKYAEAEPLLLAGYEGMKQREATIPPHGSTRIPEALERIVHLYEARDKAEPGRGYSAKAAEWKQKLETTSPAAGPNL